MVDEGKAKGPGERPGAVSRTVEVVANELVARDTYRLRFHDDEISRAIRPGQFLMVRPSASSSDPLLGRPFALYDVVRDSRGGPIGIDIIYMVVGRGTAALAERRPGDRLGMWGPLGNGFGPPPEGPVVFVAGGIGQTPFLALARWWQGHFRYGTETYSDSRPVTSVSLLYGVRSAAYRAGVSDFEAAGVTVELATDDGSAGHRGFVTELFARRLENGERPAKVVGCGPPAMLKAVSQLAAAHGINCDLSLENHMACGFGACFSCVTPVLQEDGTTDLRRVCVEGPIFDSRVVAW